MKEKLKYLFSSGVAFVIDYILLLVIDDILPGVASMEIGAFCAWCVSSMTNFLLNRYFVFGSGSSFVHDFLEYYSLAGIVFLLKSYVALELLTRIIGMPLKFAKPVVEVVFFISNYLIQKYFIFKIKRNPQ